VVVKEALHKRSACPQSRPWAALLGDVTDFAGKGQWPMPRIVHEMGKCGCKNVPCA
jgi:hypothetical protein